MSNIYHLLYRMPCIDREGMNIEQEHLAEAMVKSGRMRIDAESKSNFARLSLPQADLSLFFSWRELSDPELLPRTATLLKHALQQQKKRSNTKIAPVEDYIAQLKQEIRKHHEVDAVLEMRLARILVQSAHPVVIRLLLLEQVEVFLSYSYNIGDLLDIPTWRTQGNNNGMQSTDGRAAAIFVSCGGDPFGTWENGLIYGDGFPALARIMVIAGQEIGHYSDIIRDHLSRHVDRHSADVRTMYAKPNVRQARLEDMAHVDATRQTMLRLGLSTIAEYERKMKFFKKMKIRHIRMLWYRFWHAVLIQRWVLRCNRRGIRYVMDFANHPYTASFFLQALGDMKDNLTPQADVYRNPNPRIEEGIACIEALARIPQQANKWGHEATQGLMPHLYHIYYKQVIPECIREYQALTHTRWRPVDECYRASPWKWLQSFWQKKPWPKKVPIYE
jgi:hypothetical protein